MNRAKKIFAGLFLLTFGMQAQMIENFETAAAWMWAPWLQAGAGGAGAKTAPALYTGAFGWEAQTAGPWPWHYRTDVVLGNAGNVLGAWAKGNQRNYLGFGATGGGCWSLVLAPNTSGLIIQSNAGWGYSDLATSAYAYNTANWYYLEVTWNTSTNVTGRLYNSAMVLQTSVNLNIPTLVPAGVAFRSYCTTVCYFDDINSNVILAAQLLEFKGNSNEELKVNELNWTTGSEKNNKTFSVEKSVDGISYSPIGELPGAGNSNTIHEYSFRDSEPASGVNYYRLRQFEFDGSSTLSNVITIENKNVAQQIEVFPTVSSGKVNVILPTGAEQKITVSDVSGKVVRQINISGDAKTNSIDLSSLNDGAYLIQSNNTNSVSRKKIFISK